MALTLTREPDEVIVINGNIRIRVAEVRGKQVRLAIEAPKDIPIVREELLLKASK